MFRVQMKYIQKSMQFDPAKTHYASSKAIAEEVKADLDARFGTVEIIEETNNTVAYDPGGMMAINDTTFSFDLGGIVVTCMSQFLGHFNTRLDSYKPRGTNAPYIKIHGGYICICITPDEWTLLKQMTGNKDLITQANEATQRKEDAIQSVVDKGHLIRVVKDGAGNWVDVDKLAKKAKGSN